jgi:threonine synthase
VAGIRKLAAAGFIRREESVVAVLTGHLLKDPDYVSQYHRGTLSRGSETKDRETEQEPIKGAFRNATVPTAASKNAILEQLQRRNS